MKTKQILVALALVAAITTSSVSATVIYSGPGPVYTPLSAWQIAYNAKLAARNAAARALTLRLQQANAAASAARTAANSAAAAAAATVAP
jgi:hypothetical protein